MEIPEPSEYCVLTARHVGVSHFQCHNHAGSLCGSSSHIHNFHLQKHEVWLANIDEDMSARSGLTELRPCSLVFCLKSDFKRYQHSVAPPTRLRRQPTIEGHLFVWSRLPPFAAPLGTLIKACGPLLILLTCCLKEYGQLSTIGFATRCLFSTLTTVGSSLL
jgi:hypothetical protein